MIVLSFILPLLSIVILSFSPDLKGFPEDITLKWYGMKLEDVLDSLLITTIIGIGAAVLSTLFTLPAAYALVKRDFIGRRILDQAIIIPNLIPAVVFGLALLQFFHGVGLNGLPPILIMIFIHSIIVIPFVGRPIIASLQQFDKTIEEAAMTLGANEIRTFRDVIFPLILPGIISGMYLAFARSIADFIITMFFITPDFIPLSVRVFQSTSYGIPQVTAAIAVILLIASTGIILTGKVLFKVEIQ
jgi:ABC-type spermidine/putrescine transport system permease subunit II